MKIKLLVLAFISLLVSCSSGETIADKDIDPALRKTIKIKNDSLLEALPNADHDAVKQLASPEFIKFLHAKLGHKNIMWAIRRQLLDSGKYTILHEYYSKHGNNAGTHTITEEKEKYTFTYPYTEKETYVCLLKTSLGDIEDFVITTRYGLIDGKWKLTDLDFGVYGAYSKNAQDYYELGEKADDGDYDIDAYMYYDAANSLKDPSNKMLRYDNDEDMELKSKNTRQKLAMKYQFPKVLDKVKSHPEVVAIEPVKNAKGLYPLISYKSVIPAHDTISLKKEYEQLKAEIRKEYTGLNYSNDFMYYRVYNAETGDFHTFEDVKKKQ
jgi:hypothetical protein